MLNGQQLRTENEVWAPCAEGKDQIAASGMLASHQ